MKIVHIIIGLNVGGAELMLKRLVESHLTTDSIQHTVISLTSLGVIGPELQKQGVSVYSLNMSTMLKGPIVFFKLRALLKKLQPDVVHSWMYHADLLAGIAAFSLGIENIVWGIRSTDITKGGSKVTLIIRKLCAYLSYRIPKEIVCAAHVSKDVHVEVGYDPSKMQVIPNGFDIDNLQVDDIEIKNFKKKYELYGSRVVVSVGRYSPVKDHKTFIKAASEVVKKNPDVKFVLVGRDLDVNNDELVGQLKTHNVYDSFILLGSRKDIPVCLAAADVFCLHSVTEGFPNVLGEAMYQGCVCITTDVGDAPYLLNDSRFVVEKSNPAALASLMNDVFEMTEESLLPISNANNKRICDEFTMDVVANYYADFYRKQQKEF